MSKEYTNHVRQPLSSADISTSHQNLAIFVLSRNNEKLEFSAIVWDCFDFHWFFKGCFKKPDCSFDDVLKIGSSRILKNHRF